jgi:hypothetical protein
LEQQPFDVQSFNMTNYNDTTPLVNISQSSQIAADYPGITDLEAALLEFQKEPSLWQNLSREDCAGNYNSLRNSDYRTVVLVTNYSRSDLKNNSALAIGATPGYSLSMSNTLLALCPDDYLAKYNQSARKPLSAAYIPDEIAFGEGYDIAYISPEDADSLAFNSSSNLSRKRQIIMPAPTPDSPDWNPLPQLQLCYSFWPSQGSLINSSDGKTITYTRPRCDFLYCMAERIPENHQTCRLAYSPIIFFSWAILISIFLPAFSFSILLRMRLPALYKWSDAKYYFQGCSGEQLGLLEEHMALKDQYKKHQAVRFKAKHIGFLVVRIQ